MGCDIHCILQRKSKKSSLLTDTWEAISVLDINRNYTLFSILANVRGGMPCIASPRGLPKDIKYIKSNDVGNPSIYIEVPFKYKYSLDEEHEQYEEGKTKIWLGEHSHSWLTLDEILKHYVKNWCDDEVRGNMEYLLDLMASHIKKKGSYRIVFGFDS